MKSVDSALEVLNFASLDAIQFYETSARLNAGFPGDFTTTEESENTSEEPTQEWLFSIQKSPDHINFRARLEIESNDSQYVVDVAAFYSFTEPLSISDEILQEFINRAAMIAVYPFAREALHELARKVNAHVPILGIYNPGDIAVDLSIAEKRPSASIKPPKELS
ncbi:hypothetical protein [Umezawaea sp. NPDC059074]|uniref:hypothetical protein n=1 Tax=Umezawaea sp. NPDC059074 TaxID=3346716 RepID=UPI0036893CA8